MGGLRSRVGMWAGLRELVKARLKETQQNSEQKHMAYTPPRSCSEQPPIILHPWIQSSQREDLITLIYKSRHFPPPSALPKAAHGGKLPKRQKEYNWNGRIGCWTSDPHTWAPRGSPVSISLVVWFSHDGLLHGDPERPHSSKHDSVHSD